MFAAATMVRCARRGLGDNVAQGLRVPCTRQRPLSQLCHWQQPRCARTQGGLRRTATRDLKSVEQAVAYEGVWGALTTFPRRRPFSTNLLLSGIFMPLADWTIQQTEGGEWDARRTLLFCAFGVFNGALQWVGYIVLFSRLCPCAIPFANRSWAEKLQDRRGQRDLAKQVLVDNLLWVPCIFFPCFYSFKLAIQGGGDEPRPVLLAALERYGANWKQDNLASMSVWILGDVLVFAVPAWLRMPASHGLCFAFTMLLSYLRGAEASGARELAREAGGAAPPRG
mmetsp:Transcript_45561/g.145331  ORF Transcript_45561/g.145331 Transcript_45561/m.145331 type:complete len:282 (+) Transcript_45561:38-883(+)